MITIEQKREVIRLHEESRSKSEISRLTHISRPKVLEIIREYETEMKNGTENQFASDIVKNSTMALKNKLVDYERALGMIRKAAKDELLGPSVRELIAREGFILKDSGLGIRAEVTTFLDGMKVSDSLKILEMLRELVRISNTRNGGQESLKRYVAFAHYVINKGYSLEDMEFLIRKGKYLESFRAYQHSIDIIAERYGVPEHEALAYACIGIDNYFKRRAELEKDIKEKEENLLFLGQKYSARLSRSIFQFETGNNKKARGIQK